MSIIDDLDKLVEAEDEDVEDEEGVEEEPTVKKIVAKVAGDEEDADKASGAVFSKILKHTENVQAAAAFIDTLTTDEANTTAFEAEIALRKALSKMQDLSSEKKGKVEA